MIKMKYYSQWLNQIDPTGSCNVSCLAMALDALGIKVTPDALYKRAQAKGLIVTVTDTLTILAAEYGVVDKFTSGGTFEAIKKAIDLHRPVILRGYFTKAGHIINVKGYDKNGLIVNDPWGEWWPTGYDNYASGENLHYSWNLIGRTCSPESPNNPQHIWFHQLYIPKKQ